MIWSQVQMGRWRGERSSPSLASEWCKYSQELGLSSSLYKVRRLRTTAMVTRANLMHIMHQTLEKQLTVSFLSS